MTSTEWGSNLAGITDQRVRLAEAPLASVTELTCEALGTPMGTPGAWLDAVRDALDPRDHAVLQPVFGPRGRGFVPDCLTPRPERFTTSFDEELERLAVAIGGGELEQEVVAAGFADTGWVIACRSRRWRDGYVAALRRAWTAVRPLWTEAKPLVEREVERVAVSLARGAFGEVVATLSPRGRVEGGRWYLRDGDVTPVTIADGMVLQPMVVGRGARLVTFDGDDVDYVAYPLPGCHRLLQSERPAPPPQGLAALVGEPRAAILQRLDRPLAAGQLARDLLFSPAAITHHLIALERAGLVARERWGRHVLVHRTARGSALLHLYEP